MRLGRFFGKIRNHRSKSCSDFSKTDSASTASWQKEQSRFPIRFYKIPADDEPPLFKRLCKAAANRINNFRS